MALRRTVLTGLGLFAFAGGSSLQAASLADDRNFNSFSVLVSELEWLPFAQQLVAAMDHQNQVRVLPMLGRGSVQALNDLAQLRAVDLALVPSDVIVYAKAQGLLGDKHNSYAYMAALQQLPIVLVARKEIKNLTGLAGQKICTGPAQSGGFATGELVLGNLGIPFTRVAAAGPAGLLSLQQGRADAALVLGTDGLKSLNANQFHVLPMPSPKDLQAHYSPVLLTEKELGDLNRGQGDVESISVALTLAAMNWPQGHANHLRLKHFADVLWSSGGVPFGANLSIDVPGWQRHAAAQQALAEIPPNPTPTSGDGP